MGGLGLDLCAKEILQTYSLSEFVLVRSAFGLAIFLGLAPRLFGGFPVPGPCTLDVDPTEGPHRIGPLPNVAGNFGSAASTCSSSWRGWWGNTHVRHTVGR